MLLCNQQPVNNSRDHPWRLAVVGFLTHYCDCHCFVAPGTPSPGQGHMAGGQDPEARGGNAKL